MKLVLSKPYTFEEKTHTSIDLNLDSLRGSDITDAYRQYAASGNFSAMVSTDPNFCVRLAAAASGQPFEFFDNLPAPDFMYITQAVQNFLLSAGLVNQESVKMSAKPASSSEGKHKPE